MKDFEVLTISSLEKIFPETRPVLYEEEKDCFRNEVVSFQIAYRHCKNMIMFSDCCWEVEGELKEYVTVRPVESIPCLSANVEISDDYLLREHPSLIPDLLSDKQWFNVRYRSWGALWVTVRGDLPIGKNRIRIVLKHESGAFMGAAVYTLNVLPLYLPKWEMKYTNWMHYDSISSYYGLPIFETEYEEILWRYMENAVRHGVNTCFVPLFTPPLDTKRGGERKTVQLVDVHVRNGEYFFDFKRLARFMKKASSIGMEYFEMSHLSTQWGAESAPKIMAMVDGKYEQLFGWKDDSLGEAYTSFLKAFLTAIVSFLRAEGYTEKNCFFHISDEPNDQHISRYQQLRGLVKPLLDGYKTMDAMSNYAFFEMGIVDIPIICTKNAQSFLDHKTENWWVYYCFGQCNEYLSNRYLSMPLLRTRIIGIQLYMTGAKGLLHWGYNFYNCYLSKRPIDPYVQTDAGGVFLPVMRILCILPRKAIVWIPYAMRRFTRDFRTIEY